LTKRWIRWRLSTGITVGAVRADVRAITLFAQSFPSLHRGPQAVTREVIEAHLAHLAIRYPAPKTRTSYISAVAGLLRTARQHGWAPGLDAHVDLYRDDYPRLKQSQPRALSEAVMAQLEHADNLARFKDPRGRLLLQILMSTGLRVGDGCKLALDCIVRDVSSSGALLVLQTTEGIPRSFRLHIVGSTRERACEVRRRTARMLGVQFTD